MQGGNEMKVVTVGDNCIDDYEKLKISYPTGNSVDVAIHLSRLGIPCSIVSVTGDDDNGQKMQGLLQTFDLDLSRFHMETGKTAVTTMDMAGNDRVHLKYDEGVLKYFTLTEDDIEFITTHQIVHTSVWGKVNDKLPIFKQSGMTVIYDFSTKLDHEEMEQILPHVDYAFFSYKQHDSYIEEYMKRAFSMGPKAVVVTLGQEGSIAYDGSVSYKEGIIPVLVVNTVGAGDSFIAGFIHGLIDQAGIQECLRRGAKTASEVVKVFKPY
jgi:fructoselysine 6-kinase